MKIEVDPPVMFNLMSFALATEQEFSGFGFCRRQADTLFVYDFVLMDVGNYSETEIKPEKILPLLSRSDVGNMKVWIHRHPMGNGIPGPLNWSSTDEHAIQKTPLGGIPELVRWSASMVLTPNGWVGRVDNHLTHKTLHCEVIPKTQAYQIIQPFLQKTFLLKVNAKREAIVQRIIAAYSARFCRDLEMSKEELLAMVEDDYINYVEKQAAGLLIGDEEFITEEHDVILSLASERKGKFHGSYSA
jgi:hypothetical protein